MGGEDCRDTSYETNLLGKYITGNGIRIHDIIVQYNQSIFGVNNMRELGMTLIGCFCFVLFFNAVILPDMEIRGFSNNSSCTGECYEEYVKIHGTSVEIEQRKKLLAEGDPFSDIRSLWSGCAACHGVDGSGGVGPKLSGQSSEYISGRLTSYKNNETIGSMSAMMWGQAGMLSDKDIDTIGKFIEETMK